MADDGQGFNQMRMREARNALGWNTTKLANEVGVTELTIRKWEAGLSTPGFIHGMRLARALQLDPFELVVLSPAA